MIDKEKAISYLEWIRPKKPYTLDRKNVQEAIDMAIEALKETERNPTITSWYDFDRGYEKGKASTRPHGEWVDVPKYKGFYVCSKCLERLGGDFERFDHWEMNKENFCPVCGSDNRKRGGTV